MIRCIISLKITSSSPNQFSIDHHHQVVLTHSSCVPIVLIAGPLDCIQCPHIADVCKSLPDGEHWQVYMKDSIRERHWWVRHYFTSSAPHRLVRLTWIVSEMGGKWLCSYCFVGCCLLEKVSRFSMYTCVLIIAIMITLSPSPLNDIQIPYHEWLGYLLVFFRQSSLYVSFEYHFTKVPASSLWPEQILDSSMNITFIQLSTLYDCSLKLTLTLFSSVGVLVLVFIWLFSIADLISFNQFFQFCRKHWLLFWPIHFFSFIMSCIFNFQCRGVNTYTGLRKSKEQVFLCGTMCFWITERLWKMIDQPLNKLGKKSDKNKVWFGFMVQVYQL